MSSSSSDPLLALKQAIDTKAPVSYISNGESVPTLSAATHLAISSPDTIFIKSTPTRLRKPGASSTSSPSNPTTHPGDFYSLEAVYLAWLTKDASGADYMKQARESGLAVGFVSVTERKRLVEWLEGSTTVHDGIAPLSEPSATPPGSPPRLAGSLAALASANGHVSGSGSGSTSQVVGEKRKYKTDVNDAEVVKRIRQSEIELQDRNTVLRGSKPNNFSAIRAVYSEKLKKLRETSKTGASNSASAPTAPDAKAALRKSKNATPIIIISSSPTALITMYNVRKFLQEASFEPSQAARTRSTAEGNLRAEGMIPIYRKRTAFDPSGRETQISTTYYVVDSVEELSKFGTDAWDRVVCVMTTGQAWQFRPYKWNEPRALFHHVKGVYVQWANDPPNTKISDWNVTPLKIDPNRRHVDKSVVAEFWKILDSWMLAQKPWLMR